MARGCSTVSDLLYVSVKMLEYEATNDVIFSRDTRF